MGKTGIMITLLLMSMALMANLPTGSWVYSDGKENVSGRFEPMWVYPNCTGDTRYEKFGPRADRILVQMYSTDEAMWDALALGQIDLTDWPLTTARRTQFSLDPNVKVVSAGGEAGFYTIDFNYNPNPRMGNPPGSPPNRPNPVYDQVNNIPPISNDVNFRLGVGHLFDRTTFNVFVGDAGIPILTPIPSYMSGWMWPGLTGYAYSRVDAEAHFAAGKIKQDTGTTPWTRYWDRDDDYVVDPGEKEACMLKFTWRMDEYRKKAGEMLYTELLEMNFTVPIGPGWGGPRFGGENYQQVMLDKNYHMTTLGWINVGPDPDHVYDLYHINSYWDDPTSGCPNTAALNDTVLNTYSEQVKFAKDSTEALASGYLWQQRFEAICAQIPLCSANEFKASRKWYCGGNAETIVTPDDGENKYRGMNWTGVVNMQGCGTDNFWSFLNMHPEGYEFGDGENMTIRLGVGAPSIASLNPLYVNSKNEGESPEPFVISALYDTLLKRNPYNLTEFMPWLSEFYEVGTYLHPVYGTCTKIRFTLRPDVAWNDGTSLTVADVHFTFVELDDILSVRGLPPPRWISNVMDIVDFRILDPYNFEVLFDVKSMWALSWVGQQTILPKHVWKPICESGDPTAFAPDPNLTGSGPWRFVEYVPCHHVLMVANRIEADMTISLRDYYFRYSPVEVYVDLPTSKVNPNTHMETNVMVRNLLAASAVDVVVFVYFDGDLIDIRTLTLNPDSNLVLGPYLLNITGGFHWTRATCIITSGGLPGRDHGHVKWLWATVKEDIVGTYHITPSLYAPDFKVDMKDVYQAARAFGSYPGHTRWSPVADLNSDYKIDMGDIFYIAKIFGYQQVVETQKEPVQKWPPIDSKASENLDSIPVKKPNRWHKENIDGIDGDDYLLSNQTDKDGNIVQLWILNNGQYGVRYYDAKSKKWVWIGKCPFVTGDNSDSFKEKDKEGRITKVKWISKCDQHPDPAKQVGTPGHRWEYEYDPKTGKLTAKKYDANNQKIGGPDNPFDPPNTPGGLPGP